MLRVVKQAAVVSAAAAAVLLIASASAAAAVSPVAFVPCASALGFACAQLTVPVDPSGVIPGTITLSIERKVSVTGTATQAIVGLAGGPGQAAIPFAESFAQTLSSALETRDLIVYDQRGTGLSNGLSCPALAGNDLEVPEPTLIGECATELGPTRGLYETDDSVADIEAIREALGYSTVVIYGTSYGTKVALRFAATYPQYTGGLLLDSTVPPDGPDVYGSSNYAEIPRMLSYLCAGNACAHIGNPLADLTTVVTRLNTAPAQAKWVSPKGAVQQVTITSDDVFNLMISGDLDPLLRANLPAALHAALHGDYALLAALNAIANQPEGGINNELYLATVCEELQYPWNRPDTPAQRAAEALAAFDAQPATTFAPFTAQTAYDESDAPYCAGWQFATAAPEPDILALPNVPTLIISGTEDMRTPTADAMAVAAQIPDATLLVVPNTGHSVLGTEPTNCAQDAVNAFFAGTQIQQCTNTKIPGDLTPTPVPPHSVARVKPVPGSSGLPGKTFQAAVDTLTQALDFGVDDFLSGSSLAATVRFGGLRSGFGSFSLRGLRLHGYSYIPGLRLSGAYGTAKSTSYTLTITGPKAAAGELTLNTKKHTLSGTLGGVAVFTTSKQLQKDASAARASVAHAAGWAYARRLSGF